MKSKSRYALFASCLLLTGAASAQAVTTPLMTLVGGTPLSGAYEISAYDKFNNRIFSTVGGERLEIFDFGNGRNVKDIGDVDLSSVGTFRSFSSVSIDPLGRGFGVATAIPDGNTGTPGKAIFFNTATGAVIGSVDVGFHPDMVTFTPDGTKILIANEGEAALAPVVADAPGSVSIISLAGIASVGDVAGLGAGNVTTLGLGGVDVTGLRINPSNAGTPTNDLEPEYIAVSPDGTKAFVSVQEANAVLTIDLTNNTIAGINPLGTIVQRIDASNTDGVDITSNITSLFMPDAIAAYSVGGKTYYVTANEGDTRDNEEFPFVTGDFVRMGSGSANLDPTIAAGLDLSNAGLGRLNISRFDGDTDSDGDIDVPTAFGTRSFTIWDAETGLMVFDSGSDFEEITAILANAIYNSSDSSAGGDRDSRSDDKGPEPEAVTIGLIDGRIYAFIGLERVGGFFTYDITDPNNPLFIQYNNPAFERGLGNTRRPEGLIFISAADSPTGESFIILSHESRGGLQIYANVIPEPMTLSLLAMSMPMLLGRRHRNRA